jgi:hypothetical protein
MEPATDIESSSEVTTDVLVHSLPFSLEIELVVTDPEVLAELVARKEGRERDEYALAALRIGVLALRQARGQVDANALKREGEQLLSAVQLALNEHRNHVSLFIAGTLKEYFDPESGRFNERVDRLLRKDGELKTLLARTITAEDSELCRNLAAHLGTESPLFRLLSPDESEGLLTSLREATAAELKAQRESILNQFSLDNKEGALSRLIEQLTDHNGKLRADLKDQIDGVVKEFSLDQEDSALSRLVRQVDGAQKTISAEFSLDNEQSALSRMTRKLDDTNVAITKHLTLDDEESALSVLRRELLNVLKGHGETFQKFQTEVQVALAKMQSRKEEALRSTQHGNVFEAEVFKMVQAEAQRMRDVATPTGTTTGMIKNCKVGDSVVELGPDSAAPGARIVVEAKEEEGYNLQTALADIDTARKNRDAEIGLFVFSRRTAPDGLDQIARYGDDVVVIWDVDDAASDIYLKLGLSVAKALCTRRVAERAGIDFDFTTVDEAILEITKQVGLLDEIRPWADTIKNNSEKILERLRISREKIQRQADTLADHVSHIKEVMCKPAAS